MDAENYAPGEKRATVDMESLPDDAKIQRFGPFARSLHMVLIIFVNIQFFTGLPLYYSRASWAQWMFREVGGVPNMGYLHRIGGIMFLSVVFLHACWLIYYLIVKKGQFYGERSMVPRPKDLFQLIEHIKYVLGRGDEPKFGRYGWPDKFGWIGVFWGSMIIGIPGLMLLTKDYLPAWLLPPQTFNVVTVLHSDEAILAIGFLYVFHWFNVHWSPDAFPINTVVYTGMLTKKEMEEERPAELELLANDPEWLAERLESDETVVSTKQFPSK